MFVFCERVVSVSVCKRGCNSCNISYIFIIEITKIYYSYTHDTHVLEENKIILLGGNYRSIIFILNFMFTLAYAGIILSFLFIYNKPY